MLAVDHGQKSYFSRRLEVFSSIKVITTTGGGNFLKLKVQKKKGKFRSPRNSLFMLCAFYTQEMCVRPIFVVSWRNLHTALFCSCCRSEELELMKPSIANVGLNYNLRVYIWCQDWVLSYLVIVSILTIGDPKFQNFNGYCHWKRKSGSRTSQEQNPCL